MKKTIFIFMLLVIVAAYSIAVKSKINSEIKDLFGDNEEADVIVVLKDDYGALGRYGVSSHAYNDDFEIKKMMIKEQQEDVLSNLKIKKSENIKKPAEQIFLQDDYDFDLKNTYSTVNGFAGRLKKSSYEKLRNNQNVLKIYKPKSISALLSDSVPMVNATRVWSLIYNGANVTGKHESVCVIDSGVVLHASCIW